MNDGKKGGSGTAKAEQITARRLQGRRPGVACQRLFSYGPHSHYIEVRCMPTAAESSAQRSSSSGPPEKERQQACDPVTQGLDHLRLLQAMREGEGDVVGFTPGESTMLPRT